MKEYQKPEIVRVDFATENITDAEQGIESSNVPMPPLPGQ